MSSYTERKWEFVQLMSETLALTAAGGAATTPVVAASQVPGGALLLLGAAG